MKYVLSVLMVIVTLGLPVRAREVTLYSERGLEKVVFSDEADDWRAKGWKDRDQVFVTVYSQEGQTLEALKADLGLWSEKGWSSDPDDVRTELYSWDGNSETVWNAQVEKYLADGWARTPEELQTKLYDAAGNETVFWNAEVEGKLADGWFRTPEEAKTEMYTPDGEKHTVWKAEAEGLKAKGWTYAPPVPAASGTAGAGGSNSGKPMVALTFDDGPGPYTDKILNCLEKYGARATFFVVGNRLGSYPSQLKREAELGMEIGGHSWAHKDLTALGAADVTADVKKVSDRVYELAGIRPAIIRPPYGSHNSTVRRAAGVPLILWNIDTLDWKTKNADSTYNAVMDKVKDGDIILMHDIHSATADAVERIVPALIDRGFQLVTVSEMGAARGGLAPGKAYGSLRP